MDGWMDDGGIRTLLTKMVHTGVFWVGRNMRTVAGRLCNKTNPFHTHTHGLSSLLCTLLPIRIPIF